MYRGKKEKRKKKEEKKKSMNQRFRVISIEETAAFDPSALDTSSVEVTIDATSRSGKNLCLTISATSTARETALPRALRITSLDLPVPICVITART
jgi:hypothetical protein